MRKLERKYDHELVVVGVHSAKFTAERSTEAIRQAVQRYDVGHPVVNDSEFRLWNEYAVRAWPTLIFIDPEGRVIGRHEGEFAFDALDRAIREMIAEFDARGILDRGPLPFRVGPPQAEVGPLRFPGKVAADPASGLLFIADSGHHRIIVADLSGQVRRVVGNGEAGLRDGSAQTAQFSGPQGMAIHEYSLYVADTGNHALRRVDLASGQVTTVAGTGAQAMRLQQAGSADELALNSPWDVAVHDARLYIAMAGFHQVWSYNPEREMIFPAIGSGREGLLDGLLDAAEFAQPSGLASDGERLYVACSEASAIRRVDPATGRVETLVGLGLFEFGDVDGVGREVRLQHPLGLAAARGLLYVADTYNHKLKWLDAGAAEVRTIFGSGEPGFKDGPDAGAQFSEPGGLALAQARIFVADTNNHAIRVADLTTGRVETLQVRGL